MPHYIKRDVPTKYFAYVNPPLFCGQVYLCISAISLLVEVGGIEPPFVTVTTTGFVQLIQA